MATVEPHVMNTTEPNQETMYRVVINHEEQYSIWPVGRECPTGWREIGPTGSKAKCLDYIQEVWTDMRPRSLRSSLRAPKE